MHVVDWLTRSRLAMAVAVSSLFLITLPAYAVPIASPVNGEFYSFQLLGVSFGPTGETVGIHVYDDTYDTSAYGHVTITDLTTSTVLYNFTSGDYGVYGPPERITRHPLCCRITTFCRTISAARNTRTWTSSSAQSWHPVDGTMVCIRPIRRANAFQHLSPARSLYLAQDCLAWARSVGARQVSPHKQDNQNSIR